MKRQRSAEEPTVAASKAGAKRFFMKTQLQLLFSTALWAMRGWVQDHVSLDPNLAPPSIGQRMSNKWLHFSVVWGPHM